MTRLSDIFENSLHALLPHTNNAHTGNDTGRVEVPCFFKLLFIYVFIGLLIPKYCFFDQGMFAYALIADHEIALAAEHSPDADEVNAWERDRYAEHC